MNLSWQYWMRVATEYARRNPGVRFRIYGVRHPSGTYYYNLERLPR